MCLWPSTGPHAGCSLPSSPQDSRSCRSLPGGCAQSCCIQDPHHLDGQRQRVHRRAVWQPQPPAHWRARVRSAVSGLGHWAPPDQAQDAVERFNGRLSQVLRSHHFNSAEDLEKTLHRFVWLYNQHLPQKALGHETPIQSLKKWKMKAPDLFVKNVRNHPGPDT